jgi:hypothetical protein
MIGSFYVSGLPGTDAKRRAWRKLGWRDMARQ